MQRCLILVIFLLTSSFCFAISKTEAKVVLSDANTAFDEAEFDQAISKYEELIAEGFVTVEILHNLGLSYSEKGMLAKAVLNMSRAQRLAPLNKDINHNLRLIKENVQGSYGNMPEFFLKAWYNNVVRIASSGFWLILHLLFLLTGLFFLYQYLIKSQDYGFHRSYIIGLIIGLSVLSLLFASFSYTREKLRDRDDVAIVMKDGIPLKSGADDNSQEEGTLNQGVQVFIKDKIGSYLKVKLEDLTEGWIHEDEVERI